MNASNAHDARTRPPQGATQCLLHANLLHEIFHLCVPCLPFVKKTSSPYFVHLRFILSASCKVHLRFILSTSCKVHLRFILSTSHKVHPIPPLFPLSFIPDFPRKVHYILLTLPLPLKVVPSESSLKTLSFFHFPPLPLQPLPKPHWQPLTFVLRGHRFIFNCI